MQRREHLITSPRNELHTPSLKNPGIDFNNAVINYAVRNVEYVNEYDTIYKVIDKALKTGFRRFPVVSVKRFPKRRETVIGIVTVMDILDAFLREIDFNKKVTEIMSRDVIFTYSEKPIGEVLKKFKFARRGGFPVVNERMSLLGLITEHDVCKLFLGEKFNITIEEAMTHKPFFTSPSRIYDILNLLVNTRYRKLPIVDNKKLTGLVTDRLCLNLIKTANFKKNNLLSNINDSMIKTIYTISPEADISKAIELLIQYRLGGLIVTTNGNLKGIITERDILGKIRS